MMYARLIVSAFNPDTFKIPICFRLVSALMYITTKTVMAEKHDCYPPAVSLPSKTKRLTEIIKHTRIASSAVSIFAYLSRPYAW